MPRKPHLPLLAALLLVIACGGGTGDGPKPGASGSTAVAPPSTAQPTPATCPNGRLTNGDCAGGTSPANRLANDIAAPAVCPKILKAMGTQAVYDPDQMEPIGNEAGTSRDFDLAHAGLMLADTARLARSAKKNNFPDQDQAKATLNLGEKAAALARVCTKAGFQQ